MPKPMPREAHDKRLCYIGIIFQMCKIREKNPNHRYYGAIFSNLKC